MSTWYQFEVSVLSSGTIDKNKFPGVTINHLQDKSLKFSYGAKNGSGIDFNELCKNNPDCILIISMTVECHSGGTWIQKFDPIINDSKQISLSHFNDYDEEYEYSFHLAQEYKLLFPNDKYYTWSKLLNDYNKVNHIFLNAKKYEQMKLDQRNVDIDFDNQILDIDSYYD